MNAETKLARQRLSVLELAEMLGNVSEARRRRGMSRPQFYEYKRRFQTHGLEGLKDLPPIPKSHPQTNGFVERFHRTALDEFYRVVLRQKVYVIGALGMQDGLEIGERKSLHDAPPAPFSCNDGKFIPTIVFSARKKTGCLAASRSNKRAAPRQSPARRLLAIESPRPGGYGY
jgi:hypothetical protein